MPSSVTPMTPRLSKTERRQQFEAKVKEDEEERTKMVELRRKQHEELFGHSVRDDYLVWLLMCCVRDWVVSQ